MKQDKDTKKQTIKDNCETSPRLSDPIGDIRDLFVTVVIPYYII